jgi:hypothetical protein
MTRPDWWLGIGLLVLAILVHGSFQRYEVVLPTGESARGEVTDIVRVDRWTGKVSIVHSHLHFPSWFEIF